VRTYGGALLAHCNLAVTRPVCATDGKVTADVLAKLSGKLNELHPLEMLLLRADSVVLFTTLRISSSTSGTAGLDSPL
jgi:hypothetical protein